MNSVVTSLKGALPRPRGRHDGYAFCTQDEYWFRPAYTEGKCPLCGGVAPGGGPPLPSLLRIDRFAIGMAMFALVLIGMSALVLVTYFQA